MTALHLAAELGQGNLFALPVVEALLAAKANVNSLCTCEARSIDYVGGERLQSSQLETVGPFTPLMLAVGFDGCQVRRGYPKVGVRHVNIAMALIAARADVNVAGTNQNTVLHFVASMPPKKSCKDDAVEDQSDQESISLLKALITSRANLNAKNSQQRTALHIASSPSAVSVLLTAKVCHAHDRAESLKDLLS
jgi:hypothetical protein